MKILLLAAIACSPILSFAQSAAPSASGEHAQGHMVVLTPEESQALRDARQKALKDPTVQAAAQKMHQAMLDASPVMIARDKSLAPLIAKISATPAPGATPPPLTPEEKARLKAGRDSIIGTPEALAWQQATLDYHQAIRNVISKDPAIAAILAKMPPVAVASKSSPSPATSPQP